MLTFHKLDAYQFSIQFLQLALEVIREVPRGHADDIDQLRRSAKSTARNIAEGTGRLSPADKVKHYAIARGEAVESACSLDVMRLEGTITEDRYNRGSALLERVIATVTGLMNKPE
jgi:four helix bundle protein